MRNYNKLSLSFPLIHKYKRIYQHNLQSNLRHLLIELTLREKYGPEITPYLDNFHAV